MNSLTRWLTSDFIRILIMLSRITKRSSTSHRPSGPCTRNAYIDAIFLRLCKAYDLSEGNSNLSLRNFLETIQGNLHFFDEPNFRERLQGNAFVDSLAAEPRKPELAELQKDLESVSKDNPLVKKLMV